jgi:hypothetical protein
MDGQKNYPINKHRIYSLLHNSWPPKSSSPRGASKLPAGVVIVDKFVNEKNIKNISRANK